MTATIIFGLLTIAVFAVLQVCRPGKSIFDR
jgi:hypothetical protein